MMTERRFYFTPNPNRTSLKIFSHQNKHIVFLDNVMRPSDLFYAKLTPLLKEHGITNLDNRKEWPITVLVQVLTALMNETPDDLLAK